MRAYNDVDLHAFVDGQCSPERQAAIAAYLVTAPTDAARVATWRRQKSTIRELFAAATSEPVPLWLTVGQIAPARPVATAAPPRPAAVRSIAPAVNKPRARRQPSRQVVAILAFAAGASLATGVVRLRPWDAASMPAMAPSESLLQRALDAQATFGSDPDRPVEIADVPLGRVQSWLDARLPFRARIPDLRPSGWGLLGARLAPGVGGPGGFLVYADAGGGRLSLFVGRAVGLPIEDAPGVVSTIRDGVEYVWMSDRKDWLARSAAGLRGAVDSTTTN